MHTYQLSIIRNLLYFDLIQASSLVFGAATDMKVFMIKWLEKFPAFKSRALFLTGESYAGSYNPVLKENLKDCKSFWYL